MMDFARILRVAADAVEDFQHKVQTSYTDQRESGIDSQAVVDALAILGASVAATAAEIVAKPRCQCSDHAGTPAAPVDVAAEVDKAFGRLGLVQEAELAALRKRVVDLEQRLGQPDASQ